MQNKNALRPSGCNKARYHLTSPRAQLIILNAEDGGAAKADPQLRDDTARLLTQRSHLPPLSLDYLSHLLPVNVFIYISVSISPTSDFVKTGLLLLLVCGIVTIVAVFTVV